MSIMDKLFGTPAPKQEPAQAAAPTPGNIPPESANATTPGNSVVPAAAESPLDQFSDLWKPVENQNANSNLLNFDPTKVMEAASKVDFSRVVTPEVMQKIASGGEEGVKAMMNAMNSMSQTVYANSAAATAKIVEQAVSKAREQFQSELPSLIKRHNVSDSLREENPAFSHPAAQPILSALEHQLTQKHPNATSTELRDMAKQYLSSFASAANPQAPKETEKSGKAGEFDWSTFL